jgi:hypothetical protein
VFEVRYLPGIQSKKNHRADLKSQLIVFIETEFEPGSSRLPGVTKNILCLAKLNHTKKPENSSTPVLPGAPFKINNLAVTG